MREIKIRIERHPGTDYMFDLFIPGCTATDEEDVNETLTADGVKRIVSAVVEKAMHSL